MKTTKYLCVGLLLISSICPFVICFNETPKITEGTPSSSSKGSADSTEKVEEDECKGSKVAPEIENTDDQLATSGALLRSILNPEVYKNYIRPQGLNGTGSPVKVNVSLLIRNVENIDDVNMEYNLQMTFRQTWIDPRLTYAHLHPHIPSLQLINSQYIWIPDIFFSNEKEGRAHELMVPNFFGRIYPNGQVLVSYRISLRLSCPMTLHRYPMDTQHCPLRMASYGYLDSDMELNWREGPDTVVMANRFILPRFELTSFEQSKCSSVTATGSYGCIVLKLEFERQFGYYLIQIYAPSIMLVFVSWVAFWLEPTATEARVSLAVTAILTAVTQVDGINANVPPASYIKAIDVWTFMTLFMVFSAILQFSYINYVVHYQWKRVAKSLDENNVYLQTNKDQVLKDRAVRRAKQIDKICQVIFPLTFGIFNAIYWSYYLRSSSEARLSNRI